MEPRPPSPTGSCASFASSTASFKRKVKDRSVGRLRDKDGLLMSHFDESEVQIEECMEYVSRPHQSWDSASRELARLETIRQRQLSDTMSNASSVSAYSIQSGMSVASSRKGNLAMLPKSPPPAPDLTVGGSTIGGFSFMGPRTATSTSQVSSSSHPRSERLGAKTAPEAVVAGAAGGRSGVRSSSFRSTSNTLAPAVKSESHPNSAPGKTRDQKDPPPSQQQQGTSATTTTTAGGFTFQVTGQFVPRMAPKRGGR